MQFVAEKTDSQSAVAMGEFVDFLVEGPLAAKGSLDPPCLSPQLHYR